MSRTASTLEWYLLDDDEGLDAFNTEGQPDTVILPLSAILGQGMLEHDLPPVSDPEPSERNPWPPAGTDPFERNPWPLPSREALERNPWASVGLEPVDRSPIPFPGPEPMESNLPPLDDLDLLVSNPQLLPGTELFGRDPDSLPFLGTEPLARSPLPFPVPALVEREQPQPAVRALGLSWPVLLLMAAATLETLYIGGHLISQYWPSTGSASRSALPARLLANPMATSLPAAAIRGPFPSAEAKARPVEPPRPERRPARDREPVEPPADPPGWATIELPIQVQVFERGQFIGSSDTGRIALAAGFHELEFVNESLQFRSKQTVYVGSGKVAPIQVPLPSGTLSLNALPWSEVLVDGRNLGATPLGRVQLSIGPHQLVFRHPQLGEQTRTAVVAAGAETRVTVDLRK